MHPLLPLLLGILLAPPVTATEVFRCQDAAGRTVFSDQPCGPDASSIRIEAAPRGQGAESGLEGVQRMAEQYREREDAERKARVEARLEAARQAREEAERAAAAPPPVVYREVVPVYPYPHHHWRHPHPRHHKPGGSRWELDARGRIGGVDVDFRARSPRPVGGPYFSPPGTIDRAPSGIGRFPGGTLPERRGQ